MTRFQATVIWSTASDQNEATKRITDILETHPTLSIITEFVSVQPTEDAGQRYSVQEHALNELERMRQENTHLKAKLRSEEQRVKDISLQLGKLAENKSAVFVPEADGLLRLQEECRKLDSKRQELEQRVAFLDGVRASNSEQFSRQRDRIWELEAGIAPEVATLQAERDFWREKAKNMMRLMPRPPG